MYELVTVNDVYDVQIIPIAYNATNACGDVQQVAWIDR
jgi:hypothetical protein